MTVLGELLGVASLVLFSTDVLLVRAGSRRVPQDLGCLLALTSNVVVAGLAVAGQYALSGWSTPLEWMPWPPSPLAGC